MERGGSAVSPPRMRVNNSPARRRRVMGASPGRTPEEDAGAALPLSGAVRASEMVRASDGIALDSRAVSAVAAAAASGCCEGSAGIAAGCWGPVLVMHLSRRLSRTRTFSQGFRERPTRLFPARSAAMATDPPATTFPGHRATARTLRP